MRKILSLVMLTVLSVSYLSAQVLTDFESVTTASFNGWPNVPTVVANPDNAGINASDSCAMFVRSTEQWAHSWTELSTGLDFSTNDAFNLKVWSPIACTILFKLEDVAGAYTPVEVQQDITTPNEWVQLQFSFAGTTDPFDKIVIFFDFASTTDNTFYFDDVEFTTSTTVVDQIDLPVTFEDPDMDYTLTDFGGNSSTLGADPVDGSNTVAITTKSAGAEIWAGTTMGTSTGFANAIPFSATETVMSVKVYSPATGLQIRLKVEDKTNGAISVETEATTTVANAWETLEFDFSSEVSGTAALDLANTYDKASIFFDFGNNGAGDMFYWDDVMFMATVFDPINLPITFDDANVDYSFHDWGGVTSTVVEDPMDATNMVAMATKIAGAETWGGSAPAGTLGGLENAIPFTATDTKMNVRVYSPAAGMPILLKVENKENGAIACEILGSTTVANEWETIVFDFANGSPALDFANTYDKVAFFPDFGNNGTEVIVYFDDIKFGDVISVNEMTEENILLYPNPVSDVLTISGVNQIESVQIYNVLGEQVYFKADDLSSIDMSNFNNGLYIVTVKTQNGSTFAHRVLKN